MLRSVDRISKKRGVIILLTLFKRNPYSHDEISNPFQPSGLPMLVLLDVSAEGRTTDADSLAWGTLLNLLMAHPKYFEIFSTSGVPTPSLERVCTLISCAPDQEGFIHCLRTERNGITVEEKSVQLFAQGKTKDVDTAVRWGAETLKIHVTITGRQRLLAERSSANFVSIAEGVALIGFFLRSHGEYSPGDDISSGLDAYAHGWQVLRSTVPEFFSQYWRLLGIIQERYSTTQEDGITSYSTSPGDAVEKQHSIRLHNGLENSALGLSQRFSEALYARDRLAVAFYSQVGDFFFVPYHFGHGVSALYSSFDGHFVLINKTLKNSLPQREVDFGRKKFKDALRTERPVLMDFLETSAFHGLLKILKPVRNYIQHRDGKVDSMMVEIPIENVISFASGQIVDQDKATDAQCLINGILLVGDRIGDWGVQVARDSYGEPQVRVEVFQFINRALACTIWAHRQIISHSDFQNCITADEMKKLQIFFVGF